MSCNLQASKQHFDPVWYLHRRLPHMVATNWASFLFSFLHNKHPPVQTSQNGLETQNLDPNHGNGYDDLTLECSGIAHFQGSP